MLNKKQGKFTFKIDENKYSKDSFIKSFNDWKDKFDEHKGVGYIRGEESNMSNITHKISSNIELLNNDTIECKIKGEYIILDTLRGKCVKKLIDEIPEDLFISPRLQGTYNAYTHKYDVDKIFSFDIDYLI